MAKLATVVLGTVGLTIAGWSGAWVYGKGEIRSQLDEHINVLRAQGIAASYRSLEVAGYPFAYRGRVVEPRYQAMLASPQGGWTKTDWQAPWVAFDASLSDFGAVNFNLADQQTMQITPPLGAPPVDVAIRASGFKGRIAPDGGQMRLDSAAADVEVTVAPSSASPSVVSIKTFAAAAALPVNETGLGSASAAMDLTGVTAGDALWRLIDPAGAFPRSPANIAVQASAQNRLIGGTEAAPQTELTINIEKLSVDAAGITVEGDGAAVVQNQIPDGAFNLRLAGMSGFLDRLISGGFAPEQQVELYRVMLNSFAKAGTREGESLYTITFKNGYTYVNGAPTFMPAPRFP